MKRKPPKTKSKIRRPVFLFDVDNTLLDNDRVVDDLRSYLRSEVGLTKCERYWNIFEKLRSEVGFADYLGALQRYRSVYPHDMHLLSVSRYLIEYPFANRLFPNSLDAIRHVHQWGLVGLLTDGDVVFQPRKVERAGLYDAVQGHVLIYIHKEKELADVQAHYPADHYVMVDDKLHLLAAIKKIWRDRVTTVFVRQGHYARDPKILSSVGPADLTIERIGDLLDYDEDQLVGAALKSKDRSAGRPGPQRVDSTGASEI
jgi:FMN phosphatase YigB (HAD superfamily)